MKVLLLTFLGLLVCSSVAFGSQSSPQIEWYGTLCKDVQSRDSVHWGKPVWSGTGFTKVLASDTNKIQFVFFSYYKNGHVKYEAQVDFPSKQEDYCNVEFYYGAQSDSAWQVAVDVQKGNDSTIIISSAIDVDIEIFKAPADIYPLKFAKSGGSVSQSFPVNFEKDATYFVVFKNAEEEVINIKHIVG